MEEKKQRRAYIGIVKTKLFDSKTLVVAKDLEEAREMVLEKYKEHLDPHDQDVEITVIPFSEREK